MANELISALTKPKVKEALKEVKQEHAATKEKVDEKLKVKQEKMDDFAKMVFGREAKRPPKANAQQPKIPPNPSKPPPANDDWINFLKKKQDVPRSPDLDIVKVENISERQEIPTYPMGTTENTGRQKTQQKSRQQPTTDPDKLNPAEKDAVLKNLLQQVSDLETTMGGNISKLEAQLKAEQEKNIKLKIKLDDEREGSVELAAKIQSAKGEKENAEKALKKVSEELKEEKSLNIELFDKTISLEQTGTEDKAKITKLNSELKSEKLAKEKLEKKIEVFTRWKAECIVKVR